MNAQIRIKKWIFPKYFIWALPLTVAKLMRQQKIVDVTFHSLYLSLYFILKTMQRNIKSLNLIILILSITNLSYFTLALQEKYKTLAFDYLHFKIKQDKFHLKFYLKPILFIISFINFKNLSKQGFPSSETNHSPYHCTY